MNDFVNNVYVRAFCAFWIGWLLGGVLGTYLRKVFDRLPVGTRSVLLGAHCFFLHPWFVAWAWWKLYGFPWDPRLWVAFFVHDLGYIGKPNMDGEEGETHPLLGARIMGWLFDDPYCRDCGLRFHCECTNQKWRNFALLHSRYYAKRLGKPYSRLCVADKLATALTPSWLYLPMVNLTGEIHEYLKNAKNADDFSQRQGEWHQQLQEYMRKWVAAHRDGAPDTWTSENRHARSTSGVWQ